MIRSVILFATLLFSQLLHADILDVFRYDDGHTNWQYVANFSSSLLILILSTVIIKLFFTHRRAQRANRALEAIRNDLEIRVQERTATLHEANRKLETEVSHHKETAQRLRASEAYINNILESMPLMLIGLTADGNVTHWNGQAEVIAGIKPGDAMGKNLWEVYPTITISPGQVAQAIEQKKTITIKHSQRGQYHFDIIIYPLKDQDEPGVVVLIDDVTQRIVSENMLIQRDKMSSMGELASTMAHDINTPLQAIIEDVHKVRAQLMDSDLSAPAVDTNKLTSIYALLGDATENGQNASAIIDNLLTFAGAGSEEKQPAQVIDIMDHSLELANNVISVPSKLRFRDIAIERDYEPNLPAIPCYSSELQQVFISLFRHACNSLSQTEGTGRKPTIRVEIKERYDALWVKIQHNGVGLTAEEQKYIFEPFFNSPGDKNYDASKRLSFSYFIITEHHKGQMAVTSDVNVGTTFHMQIQLQ